MNSRSLRFALFATSLSLLAARTAGAQGSCDDAGGTEDDAGFCVPTSTDGTELCPVASIGSACGDAGATCVSAKLQDTSADGAITTAAVGACVVLPADYCPPSDVGLSCGDAGGTCTVNGVGTSTGAVGGASSTLSYDVQQCQAPGDGGDSVDAGTLATLDASVGATQGADASVPVVGVGGPKGSASADTGSSSSGGCTISTAAGAGGAGGAWMGLGAIVLWYRRRKGNGSARSAR